MTRIEPYGAKGETETLIVWFGLAQPFVGESLSETGVPSSEFDCLSDSELKSSSPVP